MPQRLFFLVTIAAVGGVLPETAIAQEANASHTHIRHVLEAFAPTPEGEGLFPTVVAEAAIALQHARLAGGDPTNIDPMIRHTRHVLNAIDPAEFANGPGLGFGVTMAAEGIVQHIELAASSSEASANVRTHSTHVVAAARGVTQRAEQIVDLGRQILSSGVYNRAYPLVEQLQVLCEELTTGTDVSDDGTISLEEGEGGIQQIQQHLALMVEGEGIL